MRQAPPESAYIRAAKRAEGDDPDWDLIEGLLARIANEVTTANYQRAGKRRVPTEAQIKPPKPKPKAKANGATPGGWKDLEALF